MPSNQAIPEQNIFFSSSLTEEPILEIRNELSNLVQIYKNPITFNIISINIPANANSAKDSLDMLDTADIMILFLGQNYGSTKFNKNDLKNLKDQNGFDYSELFINDQEELSVTHLEFRYALRQKKKTYVYILADTSEYKDKQLEFFQEVERKRVYVSLDTSLPSQAHALKILADMIYLHGKYDSISRKEQSSGLMAHESRCGFPVAIINLESNINKLEEELENNLVRESFIDQKFIYFSVEGKKRWDELISEQTYTPYTTCIGLLDTLLLESKYEFVNVNNIVDLGCGTGGKTKKIIDFFNTELKKEPSVYLVDTSFPMLESAMEKITDSKVASVHAVRTNFMNFCDMKECIEKSSRDTTAFFVLGCTFCNLQEDKFLDSLECISKPDDLLIIGVNLKSDNSPRLYDLNQKKIKSFLQAPLKRLDEYCPNISNIQIVNEIDNNGNNPKLNSKVSKAETIQIRIKLRYDYKKPNSYKSGRKEEFITIMKTTQYDIHHLKSFLEKYNFTRIAEKINSEQTYAHLIFKYTGAPQ